MGERMIVRDDEPVEIPLSYDLFSIGVVEHYSCGRIVVPFRMQTSLNFDDAVQRSFRKVPILRYEAVEIFLVELVERRE